MIAVLPVCLNQNDPAVPEQCPHVLNFASGESRSHPLCTIVTVARQHNWDIWQPFFEPEPNDIDNVDRSISHWRGVEPFSTEDDSDASAL